MLMEGQLVTRTVAKPGAGPRSPRVRARENKRTLAHNLVTPSLRLKLLDAAWYLASGSDHIERIPEWSVRLGPSDARGHHGMIRAE